MSAPPKILVVDDEPYMHLLLRHHLLRGGYQMLSARSGREALELARREQPALVIMDVMMADLDGLATLRELKQAETTRAIPVIMITANALNVTRQEAEASGAALFLTKPFSPTQLMATLRELLAQV